MCADIGIRYSTRARAFRKPAPAGDSPSGLESAAFSLPSGTFVDADACFHSRSYVRIHQLL